MPRPSIGRVGTYLPLGFTSVPAIDAQRDAVRRLEQAGYDAIWSNEVIGGKDALVHLALLLATTERMTFGTGIANIWAREPQTVHAAAAMLAEAYPHRVVLGLGVGYPEQATGTGRDFGKPLTTMRNYLQRMDSQTWPPAPEAAYPRLIGAIGPKMLALAGEVADGAICAGLPPQSTARAREQLGPDKLLVVGLSVTADREAARQTVASNLGRPSCVASLQGLGFDLSADNDELVDATVAYGSPAAISATVGEHFAAGADHVALMLPFDSEFASGIAQLVELGPVLASLTPLDDNGSGGPT